MTLLRFENLRKCFDGVVVLDGAGGTLHAGEVVLLQGGNGAGKTTLLNILGGALAPDAGEICTGEEAPRRYPEPPWRRWFPLPARRPESVARQGIGRVWQDVRLFDSLSVADNLAAADPQHPGERLVGNLLHPSVVQRHEQALQQRVHHALAALGLAGRAAARGDSISLGQSKRVALARAQIAGSRVLLLDEPLAGLDDEGRARLVADLAVRVRDESLALVIVEHASNRAPLLPLVTTVWTLANGRLQRSTPDAATATVSATEGTALAHELIRDLGTLQPPRYRREIPLPGGAVLQVLGQQAAEGTPALSVCGGRLVRDGHHTVAGGKQGPLDFALYDGETAILQAPNGWGKSSLLAALAGLLPWSAGVVTLAGSTLDDGAPGKADGAVHEGGKPGKTAMTLPAWQRSRLGLALLQSRDHAFADLTVAEALGVSAIAEPPELLTPLAPRRCENLSGGERQLLALLCVLLPPGKRVRLLDEPFTGLDASVRADVLRRHWRSDGVNLIAVPGSRAANV